MKSESTKLGVFLLLVNTFYTVCLIVTVVGTQYDTVKAVRQSHKEIMYVLKYTYDNKATHADTYCHKGVRWVVFRHGSVMTAQIDDTNPTCDWRESVPSQLFRDHEEG